MKDLSALKADLKAKRARMSEFLAVDKFSEEDEGEVRALKADISSLELQIDVREAAVKADADKEAEKEAEFERRVREATQKAADEIAAKARRLPYREAPYQAKFQDTYKYDGLDAVDLSLLIDLQKGFAAKDATYTNGNAIRVEPAALKAMALRVGELKSDGTEEGRQAVEYVKSAFKSATGVEPTPEGTSSAVKAATDPMYTGGSNIGSDWVGTNYSSEIWRTIRASTRVVDNLPTEVIPDGYSSKTWPLESTDLTWYGVSETTAANATTGIPNATVTASQIATANKNITVAKLGARGMYTGELEEDSLIRFSTQLRTQLEVSGSEMLESLVIDGDTEVSANKNINLVDSTPTAGTYWLQIDGFRKLALITNTANALSAGGSLAIEDFLKTLKLMGTAGVAGSDPTKVAFIIDGNVYYAMPQLPELKTKDVNSAATVENGFVTKIWNVPVIPSWQMHRNSAKRMVNSAGKIHASDASNTLGAAVAVRWDQWKLAYKRRMTIETTRIANADTWEIVALCRVGLGYRDTEAAAVLYNIGL